MNPESRLSIKVESSRPQSHCVFSLKSKVCGREHEVAHLLAGGGYVCMYAVVGGRVDEWCNGVWVGSGGVMGMSMKMGLSTAVR